MTVISLYGSGLDILDGSYLLNPVPFQYEIIETVVDESGMGVVLLREGSSISTANIRGWLGLQYKPLKVIISGTGSPDLNGVFSVKDYYGDSMLLSMPNLPREKYYGGTVTVFLVVSISTNEVANGQYASKSSFLRLGAQIHLDCTSESMGVLEITGSSFHWGGTSSFSGLIFSSGLFLL